VSLPRKPVETRPAGLQPLAVLPVFIKLAGRRAVLAGSHAGAAWKAKLLAAAGAEVAVFAPQQGDEMRKATAEAPAGSIHVHERGWTERDLDDAAFAVAALDEEDECAAFVAAARAAGAIVNAVDRPHLCDVQFGAIVNRSPLVVGISTEGAAPVFGQAVRSRIEALLPPRPRCCWCPTPRDEFRKTKVPESRQAITIYLHRRASSAVCPCNIKLPRERGRQMSAHDLIDQIYEAGAVPSLWTGVLDALASIAGGEGTILFVAAPGPIRWTASAAVTPLQVEFVETGWINRNARGDRLIPRTDPCFLTDLDAFTPEEMDREPFYSEFARPRGFGWCVGTTIRSPSGDALVFSVERLHAKGPVEREAVERLNGIRSHLARAALLSARLGLGRARASVEALQMLGLPAAVLTGTGKALALNTLLGQRFPQVLIRAGDMLSFNESGANRLLTLAVAQGPVHPGPAQSIAVPAAGEHGPLVAHLLPLRGAALDVFSGGSWLLFLTPSQGALGCSS
jgi:siroheme synthase-like protein